jgi:L-ascorbate metabolism protein UlaG (beta-lactamase superfamily)
MEIPFADFAKENPNPEDIRITFVNHSTFLIRHKGINIITDPIWSERTSPFQWAGPKRMRPPGIRFEDLPKIDYVLISHNHYDHLDINTMLRVWKEHEPMVICPLGVGAFLNNHGISNTIDLDWWQTIQKADFRFHCVPAQHFSGRGMFDRDATLWAGYVIESGQRKIYFAGDTGYDQEMFSEIGKRFDTIDISLIPIGAYKPQWFMSPIHVSPEEAVFIHRDVNSQKSLAMHFGTFPLADDGQKEPQNDLETALKKHQLNPETFVVPREGASYSF